MILNRVLLGHLIWGTRYCEPQTVGVSQKGSRERCLPFFFSENETEKTRKKGKNGQKRKKGRKQKKTEETEENGRKRKQGKQERNGRKRKKMEKSEATPFRRPLLRNLETGEQISMLSWAGFTHHVGRALYWLSLQALGPCVSSVVI